MILVVDASVTIAWIATDERSAYAGAALEACGSDPAIVPPLWYWEIANTLLVLERKGRLLDAASVFANVFEHIPITPDVVRDRRSRGIEEIALARKHTLSVYDAVYLATAKDTGVPLATLHSNLAKAAIAESVYFGL